MSREFYYRSISEHFLGKKYQSILEYDHLCAIRATLLDSNINVLGFLASVQEILEKTNVKNELEVTISLTQLIQGMKDKTIGNKTISFNEVWLERSVDWKPKSKDKLQRQFQVLLQACGNDLIFPLVQIVDSYSRGERFHIDMPVELFDTQGAGRWRVAIIKKIETLTATGEVFFYLNYVGWANYFDEWIAAHSDRIQPLHDKQADVVHNCEFYSFTDLNLGQEVDYYDQSQNQASGQGSRWRQGKVSGHAIFAVDGIKVTDDIQTMWSRCVTRYKTFTY